MDLSTQTPVEIDTRLSALYDEEGVLMAEVAKYADWAMSAANLHRKGAKVSRHSTTEEGTLEEAEAILGAKAADGDPTRSWGDAPLAVRLLVSLHEAREALRANADQQRPLHAEYARRGGWTRAFLVLNTNGHVHKGMDCSTCFATTRFGWLPQVSGQTEAEIVAGAGSDACTTCYPSAPVDVLRRPRTLLHLSEEEAAKARKAKAEEKAARAAAKAAKAITNPDGTPLRKGGDRWIIETEVTAEREYVADVAYAQGWSSQVGSRGADLAAEYLAKAEPLLVALAHKRGTTVEEQRTALAPKVTAKIKRDRRG